MPEVLEVIRARRLFLVPVMAILFTSWIPFVGIPACITLIMWWYVRNQADIHSYFLGKNYRKKEMSKEETEKWR